MTEAHLFQALRSVSAVPPTSPSSVCVLDYVDHVIFLIFLDSEVYKVPLDL